MDLKSPMTTLVNNVNTWGLDTKWKQAGVPPWGLQEQQIKVLHKYNIGEALGILSFNTNTIENCNV